MLAVWDDTHTASNWRGMNSGLVQDADELIAINVRGIVALRWVAVVGQLLTILCTVAVFGVKLPLVRLLIVLGATATVNVSLMILYRWSESRQAELSGKTWLHLIGLSMLFDLSALTALLYLTGGTTNPFCLFYFVNIALAAIMLPRPWVWALTLLAALCIGFLSLWYRPLVSLQIAEIPVTHSVVGTGLLRLGSFIAYSTCGSVIVLFITRIRGQVEILEAHIKELAQARARSERLDSLGTLAAGAAHELSSPLSTIAVITKEVEQELVRRTVSDQTIADISLIRTELDRCRDILDRMSTDAGLVIGESLSTITLADLIDECTAGMELKETVKVTLDPAIASTSLRAPLQGLSQAIRGIVKNAVDAAGSPREVWLEATLSNSRVKIKIEDNGTGIDAETLRRIGEPFFTTKEPGQGMGLGVYLARNVIERLGGTIDYTSRVGQGTVATITIPLDFSKND